MVPNPPEGRILQVVSVESNLIHCRQHVCVFRSKLTTDRVTVEFDAEVAHCFERKPFFPRQEIVEKKGNGNLVLAFDAHNEMDLREHLARWMPYFRVLSPGRYREYLTEVAGECSRKNA